MRRLRLLLSLSCAIAITAVGVCGGAPLNREDVPAAPQWVIHIDCDALRRTYVGRYLLYQLNKPEMYSNIMAFQSIFSFDLRTETHGLTFFNDGPTTLDTVTLLYADYNPDRLIKTVKAAANSKTLHWKSHTIYSWTDPGKKPGDDSSLRKYGVFEPNRIIVGASRRAVTTALAAINGPDLNLAGTKDWPSLGRPEAGRFIQAAARNCDFLASSEQFQMLKGASHLELNGRETNEQVHLVLTADAADEGTAREMVFVVQGLMALLKLDRDHPEYVKVADGFTVKHDNAQIIATLSVPSRDAIAAWKIFTSEQAKNKAGQ